MTSDHDDITSYDYELPPELIADVPVAERDTARMLIVDRSTDSITHGTIRDLPRLLSPGDCLVLNNTRVVPARLRGVREATGGKWEGLFLREIPDAKTWELLGQTRGRLQPNESILIESWRHPATTLRLKLTQRGPDGTWHARPESEGRAFELLERYGEVPLPPYIRKGAAELPDVERYQTVYADIQGSVAAPTAGLHLTHTLLDTLARGGVDQTFVTLHVGVGTFRPVTAARLSEHTMHVEQATLTSETAQTLRQTRHGGGRIVAVGTTSVRVLESAAADGEIHAYCGETNLFIRPPYAFRAVDVLLTNFHLPRSTLLVLVSTFAGRQLIRRAYAEAIAHRYRFYSYGDAMLIL